MKHKVLIFIPCLNIGGTEIHTLALVRTLASGGYDVAVCGYFEHDESMLATLREAGAKVVLLGLLRDGTRKNLLLLPRLTQLLIGVIHREKPDVVHVQYMTPGLPPLLAAPLDARASHDRDCPCACPSLWAGRRFDSQRGIAVVRRVSLRIASG